MLLQDSEIVQKYEHMLAQLYVAYTNERKRGVVPSVDSVILRKIQSGEMLVKEIKRQIANES